MNTVMSSTAPEKPLLTVLSGKKPKRPPFWFMRQAGRYLSEYREMRARAGSFLDLVYAPEMAAEVTLQPVKRFGTDGAILFSDILIVPHALGQTLDFKHGEGPVLDPITKTSDLSRLSLDQLHKIAGPVYETVRQVKADMPPHVALIGFSGGLWTVASYMVAGRGGDDQRAAKRWAYGDPEGFGQLLALLEDATVAYLLEQVKAGADVLQIFDSWAGNLPEPMFTDLVIAPTSHLVTRVKEAAPHIPIIGFPRGAGPLLGRYVAETGVDAVSLDTGMCLTYADETLPRNFPTQGNLDPQMVVAGGPMMEREMARILTSFHSRPHIFNLGHGFVPETPVAHVEALVGRLHDWQDTPA